MKDPNPTYSSTRRESIEDTLRNDAQRLPAFRHPGLVSKVMREVRASPRIVETEGGGIDVARNAQRWMPWLMAGATATAAVIIAISVTSFMDDSPTSTLPRQTNLPRIVESRVDPVLASREQDLAGELKRIRADLDSIGRMVSIRLESDSE